MHLLFLGPPGSGKGTQAKLLAEKYGLMHVAPGDIFRAEIKAKSELGRLVEGILASGALVDDATTVKIIEKRLGAPEGQAGFVLDGFPRNLAQAGALESMLASTGQSLDLVLDLVVPEELLVGRAKVRRVCSACGKPYSLAVQPPRVAGKCDVCGGDLVVRKDDNEETVRERLRVYRTSTKPLEDYYGHKGLVAEVDGEGEVSEVSDRIASELRRRNLIK